MLWRDRTALLRTVWVTHGATQALRCQERNALITPHGLCSAHVCPMHDPIMSTTHARLQHTIFSFILKNKVLLLDTLYLQPREYNFMVSRKLLLMIDFLLTTTKRKI